jgi:hypothetical protein
MNTPARELIDRLLVKILHRNVDNNDIDDVEALVYLNEAEREVTRWYSLYYPEFVYKEHTHDGMPGETGFTLPEPFTIIREVKVDGQPVIKSGPMVPPYAKAFTYSTRGFDRIHFDGAMLNKRWKGEVTYLSAEQKTLKVPSVADPLKPNETDVSLFPQIWDDAIIAHAHISYEAARGMMQDTEAAAKSKWFQQVTTLYHDNNNPTSVGEYYQGYAPRGDYM